MKKLLLLTAAATIIAAPATAVQKCVALDASGRTCYAGTATSYYINWTSQCDNYIVGTPRFDVSGVGYCWLLNPENGPSSPISWKSFSSAYASGGSNCWCQMLSPAVSGYVYAKTFDSQIKCNESCSSACAVGFYGIAADAQGINPKYQTHMFQNLSD